MNEQKKAEFFQRHVDLGSFLYKYYGWLQRTFHLKPPKHLRFNTQSIIEKYADRPKGEIIFYGASNFRLWTSMDEDFLPFPVQNHGFGGATDFELVEQAEKLLYPFEPSIVFFLSGSNALILGRKVDEIKAQKDLMFSTFRQNLPDAIFAVMSGLPLPGRTYFKKDIQDINAFLSDYVRSHEKMHYIDAGPYLLDGDGTVRSDFLINDLVHLNKAGRVEWMKPMKQLLEKIYPVPVELIE